MKTYTCICGKTFDNPQKFNGHKQGCSEHIISKYGSLDVYYNIKNREAKNNGKKRTETAILKKEKELQKWIAEQHVCERCGVLMTSKYASGRFCSRSCANGHTRTEQSKKLTSEKMKVVSKEYSRSHKNKKEYTKICCVCGLPLPEEFIGRRTTCSEVCKKEIFRRNALKNKLGGPSKTSSYGKRGTYRGIHCDSTYELALLIYCLDHNIKIVRNTLSFPYSYEGKSYNYYPDFYLEDHDVFIETKGRDIGPVYEKAQGVIDAGRKIKILHYEDLSECFQYVVDTYGVTCSISSNTLHLLYDS